MRRSSLFLLLAACAPSAPPPVEPAAATPTDARYAPRGALQGAAFDSLAARAVTARVGRVDPSWESPANADDVGIARAWATHFAPSRGVGPAALASLRTHRVVALREGGSVVTLRAFAGEVPVVDGDLTVLVDRDGHAIAWSVGVGFGPGVGSDIREARTLDATQAVAIAVRNRFDAEVAPANLVDEGTRADGWARLAPPAGAALTRPARARAVAWSDGRALEAAWEIEVAGRAPGESRTATWALVVSARDGRVLRSRSLDAHSFDYRVWADTSGMFTPSDSPYGDPSPHPTGAPDGTTASEVAASLVTMEGFNTNPSGSSDPWLDPGATETSGNNVDAWTDRNGDDTLDAGDFRAETTSSGVFDYPFDPSIAPTDSEDQAKAGIVQAFYTTNWLHDWYYDSGFDEVAGNAQSSNYGRGGAEGDVLVVQLLDNVENGSSDNANMSTPADGASPRMQIYVWSGADDGSVAIDGAEVDFEIASFGPQEFAVTAEVALGTDTSGFALGCSPILADVAGRIALVNRGTCSFDTKAAAAEAAGAVGVLLANSVAGVGPVGMSGSSSPTIPVVSISYEDGEATAALLEAGAVTAELHRAVSPDIDGALDSTVVAHEWGHYLHLRLASCGQTQCRGMGEGWADFVALHLLLRDGDDLEGAYPVAAYSYAGADEDALYYGIRRAPYSANTSFNALSFRHISDGEPLPSSHPLRPSGSANSQVHNAGEIWAVTLFQAYVALQESRDAAESFDDVRRRMSDIVVAGLALTPSDATYLEARDALLAAAAAIDPNDAYVLAEAFATRGMGSCAEGPASDSTDLVGVVEDFDLAPGLAIDGLAVGDDTISCDADGLLDAGEAGAVTVAVTNAGGAELSGATVSIAVDAAGVTFPDGDTVAVPTLGPWERTTVTFAVAVDRAVAGGTPALFTATATAPDACEPTVSDARGAWLAADVVAEVATNDSFDADAGAWTVAGADADQIWARVEGEPLAYSWLGVDLSGVYDARLVTPALNASATDPLILTLATRWSFETSDGIDYDGGVVEVSTDGGGSWEDVSAYVDPGYTGTLSSAGNPLADRQAYTGTNASWPAFDTLSLDLGTSFSGSSVMFAFRIGTDESVGDFGWEIDDVVVAGVAGTPFPAVVAESEACDQPPVADAGADQVVTVGDTVTLDGRGSSDPAGDALTYAWTETTTSGVTLDDADAVTPTFVAPTVTDETTLVFELRVADALQEATDTVEVRVVPPEVDPDTGGDTATDTATDTAEDTDTDDGADTDDGGGKEDPAACGCDSGSPGRTGAALVLSVGLLALRRRRGGAAR